MMTSLTLFGLCGAALVGLGLYGAICHPGLVRKILALNLLSGGLFLLFGVIARRAGGDLPGVAAVGADPVPQALVITGLVVAFAATALALALALRLADTGGSLDLDEAVPGAVGTQPEGDQPDDHAGKQR
jgi:multicomponent Na+:H+ antiporter subunit C